MRVSIVWKKLKSSNQKLIFSLELIEIKNKKTTRTTTTTIKLNKAFSNNNFLFLRIFQLTPQKHNNNNNKTKH